MLQAIQALPDHVLGVCAIAGWYRQITARAEIVLHIDNDQGVFVVEVRLVWHPVSVAGVLIRA